MLIDRKRQRPYLSISVAAAKPKPVTFCVIAKKHPVTSGEKAFSKRSEEISVGIRFLIFQPIYFHYRGEPRYSASIH